MKQTLRALFTAKAAIYSLPTAATTVRALPACIASSAFNFFCQNPTNFMSLDAKIGVFCRGSETNNHEIFHFAAQRHAAVGFFANRRNELSSP